MLLERWTSTHDVTAFEALEESKHDVARLDVVPEAVRTYPGALSTRSRQQLLETYGAQRDRRTLLVGKLEDRKAAQPKQRPTSALLVLALEMLSEDLAGEDPAETLDVLAEICSKYRDVPVRVAVYEVLGHCRPTKPVIDLLLRRKTDDGAASKAVSDAVSSAGRALVDWAASSVGAEHAEVLERLTLVDPPSALPFARAILDLDTDSPSHRALAAEILGDHGDDSDIERLEAAHRQEPDPDTEEAMAMAIRKRKVGTLAAAHLRLGELAGLAEQPWQSLDEKTTWDNRGAALVEALDPARRRLRRRRRPVPGRAAGPVPQP